MLPEENVIYYSTLTCPKYMASLGSPWSRLRAVDQGTYPNYSRLSTKR